MTTGAAEWPVLVPDPVPGLVAGSGATGRATAPTMSVVVAAYQAEATIGDAVASALDQTVPPLEVVVCDDGSTDRTGEVLASFGDRIRVVRRPNGGEAAAKNAAVRAARGDYVVVLDADDTFDPRRLEALTWLAARRPDLDVLTTDALVEVGGRVRRTAYGPGWRFETADQRRAILVRNFVFGLAAVRRERWLEVGGFDEALTHTADWDFWQRLVLTGSRIGLVDAPLARYRLTTGSLSADRVRLVEGRVTILRRAAGRPDLTEEERAAVTAALAEQRRLLLVQRAKRALETGSPEVRRASLAVARDPRIGARTRLKALAAAVGPRLAVRRYRDRTGSTVEVGAGLRAGPDA